MLNQAQSVASVVLDHSECAQVFQRHRIDFCCRGELSLARAAEERGVALPSLIAELEKAIVERKADGPGSLRELPTPELLAHIVGKHHAYLRSVLPFVRPLAAKVARVHGDHNPKLRALDAAVGELVEVLLPHLDDEERALFPALVSAPREEMTLRAIASMRDEHLAVAGLLERIRDASDDFGLPDWACRSYRALFGELEAIERDIFQHVHLENHVLAPRFEAAACDCGAPS